MSKRRKKNIDTVNTVNRIDKNIEIIAKNSEETNKNLDSLINSNKSKLTKTITIVTFLAALVTISGFTLKDLIKKNNADPQPQFEIYLSSEYSKIEANAHTDILATLNFDANAVSIAAYMDSDIDGDILKMERKNETEWHKKVRFEHTGIYKVVATATAPNGDIIEGYVEIEVVPPSEDMINQIIEMINGDFYTKEVGNPSRPF